MMMMMNMSVQFQSGYGGGLLARRNARNFAPSSGKKTRQKRASSGSVSSSASRDKNNNNNNNNNSFGGRKEEVGSSSVFRLNQSRLRRKTTTKIKTKTNAFLNKDGDSIESENTTGNDRYEEKTGRGTLNTTNADSQRRSRRFGASSSSSNNNNMKGSVTTKSTRELASTLANRNKNVLLLVETTNCRYCEQVEPTFAAMAAMFAGDESIEVQRVVCKTPEQKAFAGKYFRARSFPTICTLPRGSGPLFRHASSDRSIGAILEFTRETTGAVPNAGRGERYADDLTRRNDWLRQIQQGGLESTTSMAGSYESTLFDDRRGSSNNSNNNSSSGGGRRTPPSNNNKFGSYGAEYATRASYLRQQQQNQQRVPQSSRFAETNYDRWNSAPPSQQYRSYYGDQEFSRAEEEQYFGQLALDPKDDAAFENQFQSRRNHNYRDDFSDIGGGGGNYYYGSPAFQYNNNNSKVQITDVFSQASRDSIESVKRVHQKVTQVVAELPATAARIAQTDIVPAFALGLVLSAIISSFGNLIQSIRRDRFRRYQKMQRSGQRTLTEREEALVEIEREFSEMALIEWKTATREEMMEIPKQFWILCNAYAAIVFRIWEVRINEAILSCGNALKAKLGLRREDEYYEDEDEDESLYYGGGGIDGEGEEENDDAAFYNYGGSDDNASSQYMVNRDGEIMGYQGPDYDTRAPPQGSGSYDDENYY